MMRHAKRFETCKKDKAATPFFECLWNCHRPTGICNEQIKIETGAMVCKIPIKEEIIKRTNN